MEQLPQPSFHKNFELLIEDIEEKQNGGFDTGFLFQQKNRKKGWSLSLKSLNMSFHLKSFKSELHEGFVDNGHKLLVYTDHQIFDRYQRYKAKNTFAKI